MSAGPEDNMRDLFDDLLGDWTNRETLAAHVHLSADSGLVHTAVQVLQVVGAVEGDVTPGRAGLELAGLLEQHLQQLDDARLDEEYWAIVADVVDPRRVDWAVVGAAFLEEHYAA